MAKAKRLASGKWRTLVYAGKDANGKRVYESFTADTRKESEYQAAQFALNKNARPDDITVAETIKKYIDAKEAVLSPATIRGYRSLARTAYTLIGREHLRKLTSTAVQVWISDFSQSHSPKTVRNAYTLLFSAMEMFAPDLRLKVTLPEKRPAKLYTPSDQDVKKLLEHIQGKELEIAVLLAAFGPLRRGEICALDSSDIHGNMIYVNKSMVQDPNGAWRIKQPKTLSSYREIEMPQFVIDRIAGRSGRIIQATPSQISDRFRRAIKYSKLPYFRFHDLRHYSASIMHAIGIPDQYIMDRGGWKTDNVMKGVYRNVIDLEKKRQNQKFMKHIDKMQHEMQHGS